MCRDVALFATHLVNVNMRLELIMVGKSCKKCFTDSTFFTDDLFRYRWIVALQRLMGLLPLVGAIVLTI